MLRTHRDRYTDTNMEIHIKTFHELRPDLEIGCFALTRTGLQETCRSENVFDAHSWKKIFWWQIYIIIAMLNLESIVNFLFFLLHHFLVVLLFWLFLPAYCTVAVLSKLSSGFYSLAICVLVLENLEFFRKSDAVSAGQISEMFKMKQPCTAAIRNTKGY